MSVFCPFFGHVLSIREPVVASPFPLSTWKQVFGGKSDANSIRFERASARARTRRAMTASFKIGFLNSITRELIVLAAGPRGSQSIVFIVWKNEKMSKFIRVLRIRFVICN